MRTRKGYPTTPFLGIAPRRWTRPPPVSAAGQRPPMFLGAVLYRALDMISQVLNESFIMLYSLLMGLYQGYMRYDGESISLCPSGFR